MARIKKGFQRYLCKNCRRSFNGRTATILDKSKFGMWEWFYLIKESQMRSLYSIAIDLGGKYEHVWRNAKKLAAKLRGSVEMDETYITVGEKGNKKAIWSP